MTTSDDGEVLSGEVGRSFVYDGVEYWFSIPPEPQIEFPVSHWRDDALAWRIHEMMWSPMCMRTPRISSVTGY